MILLKTLILSILFLKVTASEHVYPNSSTISYTGRFDFSKTNTEVVYDWPCCSISNTFIGSSISVSLRGGYNYFHVIVDNNKPYLLKTDDSLKVYLLASGLDSNLLHTVTLIKRTEASYFILKPLLWLDKVYFKGFLIENGTAVTEKTNNKTPRSRKIEFFGDSDSNGFGILGPDSDSCILDLVEYEDCYLGYDSLLGRALDADVHIEAWSGKGVVKNAADLFRTSSDPMPIYWNRTVATIEGEGSNLWNFESWIPSAVVVYLGSNDYYNEPFPNSQYFHDKYIQLLEKIAKSYHNNITIINICGGYNPSNHVACIHVEPASKQFSTKYPNNFYIQIPQNLLDYPEDFGCLGHRNVVGQQKLFKYLLPKFKNILKW